MPQLSENTNLVAKSLIRRKTSIIIRSIEKRWIAAAMQKRRISWNTALRDICSDRIRVAPGVISARSLIQGLLRIRRTHLVNLTGAFDRAAIMALAVEAAKAHRLRTGVAWSVSMSIGLTAAWQAAKAARLTATTRAQAPIEHNRETSRCGSPQLRRVGREESVVAYGDAPSAASLTRSPRIPLAKGLRGAAGSLIPAMG